NLLNTTTFSVPSGLTLAVTGALTASPGANVNKFVAGKLVLNNVRANGANISGGGTLAIAPSGGVASGTSRVGSLTITSSRFDLSDNKLIINGGSITALTS